jgi:hypothetical protein
MSSIRRILSGISTAATWAARLDVTAPVRHQPTAPVEPVRRGFSDHSDFQSAEEAEHSLLAAHSPNLAGRPRKGADPLSAYTGRSDFQARTLHYHHLLGTNVPAPPARYWEAWRSRSAPSPASQEPQAGVSSRASRSPSLAAPGDLEKSFEAMGEEDSVLLYTPKDGAGGRSVIQHADGSVTDPADPENRLADAQAWESAHPELKRAVSLSRDDLELVLAMPEGRSRDEILSELANTDTLGASSAGGAQGDGFMPSLDDLPVDAEPTAEPEAVFDDFMPSLEDLPGSREPMASLHVAPPGSEPLTPEELEAQLSPTGELAEGRTPLEVAEQTAQRGTPEMQAQVATALYEKSQTPGFSEAPAYTRGAALAASGSPLAAHALLQRVGEANLADFVRSVMQA